MTYNIYNLKEYSIEEFAKAVEEAKPKEGILLDEIGRVVLVGDKAHILEEAGRRKRIFNLKCFNRSMELLHLKPVRSKC